jgi:hypothetical protein
LILAFLAFPATAQQTSSDQNQAVYTAPGQEEISFRNPDLTPEEWAAFSERISYALASHHPGLQAGAMRQIIAYGHHMTFRNDDVLEVMRLYRNGDTESVRRMAVVALATMNSEFAMTYIERMVNFEKVDQVRYTMRSILQERNRLSSPL